MKTFIQFLFTQKLQWFLQPALEKVNGSTLSTPLQPVPAYRVMVPGDKAPYGMPAKFQ